MSSTAPQSQPESIYRAAAPVSVPARRLLPHDLGFSGLGLLMQYSGWLFVGLWFYVLMLMLLLSRGNASVGPVLLLCALGTARSVWGAVVGSKLAKGERTALRALRLFGVAGLGQSVIMAVIVHVLLSESKESPFLNVLLMLGAWPVCLLALTMRPSVSQLSVSQVQEDAPPTPSRNFGLEGLGALMIMLGVVGLALAFLFAYAIYEASWPGWLTGTALVCLLLFGIRAVMHISAGVATYRESSPRPNSTANTRIDAISAAVTRYAKLSFASTGVFVMFLFLAMISTSGAVILVPLVLFGPLLMWPIVVTRYVANVRFRVAGYDSVYGSSSAQSVEQELHPSEDSGLSALGFFLVGSTALSLASLLANVFSDAHLPGFMGMGQWVLPGWATWASTALSLATGIGFVIGVAWSRKLGLLYALVSGVFALWNLVEASDRLGALTRARGEGTAIYAMFWIAILSICLPVMVGVLSLRNLRQQNASP